MIFEFSNGMAKVKSPDDIKIRRVRKTDSSKSGSAGRSGKQNGRSRKKAVRKKTTPKRKRHNRNKTLMLSGWFAAAIISVLAIVIIFLHPREASSETGAKVPRGDYKYVVDLSHHNPGRIVWDSLSVMTDKHGHTTKSINKAERIIPVSYVILKASEGISLKDKNFNKNWKAAGKAGLGRGAYHFFRTSKSPEVQARNFINAAGRIRESDLPPILDIETTHKGYTKDQINAAALTWLKIVGEHYGRAPIVYSSEAYIRDILSDKIRENYPLWIARYRFFPPDREDWAIWQFTDKAVVYGIDGLVDLNVMKPDFTE